MKKIQIGKMYCVKKFFWLLYPTRTELEYDVGVLASVRSVAPREREDAYEDAKWYSELYSCNFDVVEENTCFVLLEQDKDYFKLLNSNGNIGWIYCREFSRYFELVKE